MNSIYDFRLIHYRHRRKHYYTHEGQIIYEHWNMLLKYGAENKLGVR